VIVCGGHKELFYRTRVTDSSPLIPKVYIEIYLDRTSGISHPISQQDEQLKRSKDELQVAHEQDFQRGMGALSWSHDRSPNRRHGMPLLDEPSSCSMPKKCELFLRSFPLAKGRVRSMG
jgi:hypothetical protein